MQIPIKIQDLAHFAFRFTNGKYTECQEKEPERKFCVNIFINISAARAHTLTQKEQFA